MQNLNDGIFDDKIKFLDFVRFRGVQKALPTSHVHKATFDSFNAFETFEESDAWCLYSRVFGKNPSYDLFLEFKDKKSLLNWGEIQCEEPTFSNYMKFIVERDSVDFDWLQGLGRIPRFEEYMIYWETVKDFGEDELKSEQLSFRSILEQGRANNPS